MVVVEDQWLGLPQVVAVPVGSGRIVVADSQMMDEPGAARVADSQVIRERRRS